jgi:hypothetical protein
MHTPSEKDFAHKFNLSNLKASFGCVDYARVDMIYKNKFGAKVGWICVCG